MHNLEGHLVPFHDLLAELYRLFEQESCIQGENPNSGTLPPEHIEQYHTLGSSERKREGQAIRIGLQSPAENLLRAGLLQPPGYPAEFFRGGSPQVRLKLEFVLHLSPIYIIKSCESTTLKPAY